MNFNHTHTFPISVTERNKIINPTHPPPLREKGGRLLMRALIFNNKKCKRRGPYWKGALIRRDALINREGTVLVVVALTSLHCNAVICNCTSSRLQINLHSKRCQISHWPTITPQHNNDVTGLNKKACVRVSRSWFFIYAFILRDNDIYEHGQVNRQPWNVLHSMILLTPQI